MVLRLRSLALAAVFALLSPGVSGDQAPPFGGEEVRTVAGLDQAAASGASPAWKFFFDFYISRPVPLTRNQAPQPGGLGPRFRWWGNVRLASAPRQTGLPIRSFTQALAVQTASLNTNELVQSGEFLTGPEFRLAEFAAPLPNLNNHGDPAYSKVSLHFIAGFGALGYSNPKDTLQFFEVPPEASQLYRRLIARYPQAAGHKLIGFTLQDRDRFLRQYSFGLRLRTHYFDAQGNPLVRPPANLDITFGQNEANSGGRLHGGLFRIEAFYPLPLKVSPSFTGVFYLYGMASLRPVRALQQDPLLLNDSGPPDTIRQNSTVFLTIPQSSRDSYRIGLGVDLVRLISVWASK
jgi:hypothetical protein